MKELKKDRRIAVKTQFENKFILDFVVWVKYKTDENGFEKGFLSTFRLFAKARTVSRKGKEIPDFLSSHEYKSLSQEERVAIASYKERFMHAAQDIVNKENQSSP